MGYALCYGYCIVCRQLFAFNPTHVPSIIVNGEREPVCEPCVRYANKQRAELGYPLFVVHANAYEPCNEDEL